MKNKKRLIFGILAAAAVFMAAAAAIFINRDLSADSVAMDLYFMNEDSSGIVAEPHELKYKDDTELVENAVERLRKGPSSSHRGRIMPRDTRLQRLEFPGDDSVIVDFSENFLSDDTLKNVLSVYAVTKTLCSTGKVDMVKVTVNGGDITDRDGNPMGFVAASDINLETEEYSREMRDVVLYFGDRATKGLVREERTIKITDQQPIEQYIINELIKGPDDKNLQPVLSPDTVLVSVDVEDNICYLNFRSNFLKENAGDSSHEAQVIYSIVNSLTELQTISRVQFYMDGKRMDSFGSFNIKEYISRDTEIIQEKPEE